MTGMYSFSSPSNGLISPDTNLCHLPAKVTTAVVREVDTDEELLQSLMAFADGTVYQLSLSDRHECLKKRMMCASPITSGEWLLSKWGNKGMTVEELSIALDLLRLETPLLMLTSPRPLQLVTDLPLSVEVKQHNTLTLDCKATSLPYPRYCWFKDQHLVARSRTGHFQIVDVGLNDWGTYVCRIHSKPHTGITYVFTSQCEVKVTEVAAVEPFIPTAAVGCNMSANVSRIPHFIKQPPREFQVCLGSPVRLSVDAEGASPLRYIWTHDGSKCSELSSSPDLKIEHFNADHKGRYVCTVENSNGHKESNVCQLHIKGGTVCAITFTEQPANMNAAKGSDAFFRVKVLNSSHFTYQWYFNNKDIPGATRPKLKLTVEGDKDEGDYQCHVTDTQTGQKRLSEKATLSILTLNFATDKLALIIGQASYRCNIHPLQAVKNDVYYAYDCFTKLGYKALAFLDLTLKEMNNAIMLAIDLMSGQENKSVYVVLWLVGHGFTYQGNHYLMPYDAMEGTELSSCLSIEHVEGWIDEALNPEMLFIAADMCRQEKNGLVEPEPDPRKMISRRSKKAVHFYACTYGEEALETAAKKTDNRGIFNKDLLSVLLSEPMLKLGAMQAHFNDVYKHSLQNEIKPAGREMTPQFASNILENDRSLGDNVTIPSGSEEDYQKRLNNWKTLNRLPSECTVELNKAAQWRLVVNYKQRCSNVMDMIITEQCPNRQTQPPLIFSITHNNGRVEESCLSSVTPQKKCYRFPNLQCLTAALEVSLHVQIGDSLKAEDNIWTLPPFKPLIVSKWNNFSQNSTHANREACEQDEGLDFSSMESQGGGHG